MRTDVVRRVISVGAAVHAVAVTAIWAAMFYSDVAVLSGRTWLTLAWAWVIWPASLMLLRRHIARLTVGVVVVSALVLLPTVSTIFTFTVWSTRGFAP